MATATFVVIASMVGVGVLTTSGYTVALVGSNQWMLLLWVLGGVTALCGALTLAELSAAIPKTGGDYVYLYEAYGPLPAFLSGWVSFLIGFSAPSASAAFAAAKYVVRPFAPPGSQTVLWERALATVAILTFALIHISGRKRTANVQGWITALKLAVLGVVVLAGLSIGWPNTANLVDRTPLTGYLAITMMGSMVYVSYAYIGWNAASYMAGEIRDPQRLLPRAILLGTGGVLLLYLLLNVVYALALTPADIHAIVDDPANHEGLDAVAPIAQIAATRLFGRAWSTPLSVAIGAMLLSTLSAYVLIGPRVIFAMAQAGQFPAIAARLTQRAQTPAVATALQITVALVLLWTGSFESIVVYASVGLSIFSMLAMSSIFILRWRLPDLERPFRTPAYPLTPAFYLVVTGLLTAAAFHERARVSLFALLSILAGVPVYYCGHWYFAVLNKYAVFSGRARRAEFWMFSLMNLIISVVLVVLVVIEGRVGTAGAIGLLYSLAVLITGIAVSVRRLHDTGRSGWWLLLAVVPFVDIILIVFWAGESRPGSNQYGPNPKVL
ncbi:MAG: amino acid permease [Isosphaeraceae bacterium]